MNVTQGFVGEAECALFARGRVWPLGEPRIAYDDGRAGGERGDWRLEGEGTSLVFAPKALHAQRTNLVVVRSRFLQPVGVFRGRLGTGPEAFDLEAIPGVTEAQDVVW
jgi:hypothetical protein